MGGGRWRVGGRRRSGSSADCGRLGWLWCWGGRWRGFAGGWEWWGQTCWRWHRGCRWHAGRLGQTAQAVGGERRTAAGGRWPTWRSPARPLGEAAEGALGAGRVGWGLSRRRWRGVGGPGGVGPAGCWDNPGPRPARPCSFAGQLGRRFGGREPWGWPHGLGQVTATGGSAALPPGLGAGRPAASGRGRRPAPAGGAPGCRTGNPRTGPSAAGRSRIRLRRSCRNHIWATRPGCGPNPPAGGPCGRRPRLGETHPVTLLATGMARRVPGPTSVLSQPHRGAVQLPTDRLPPTRAQTTHPRVHQPGRAGSPPAPSPSPGSPREGTATPKGGFNSKPRDEPHRLRELLHPRKPRPPVEGWRHPTTQPPPHSHPPTVETTTPTPTWPQPPNQPQPETRAHTTPAPHTNTRSRSALPGGHLEVEVLAAAAFCDRRGREDAPLRLEQLAQGAAVGRVEIDDKEPMAGDTDVEVRVGSAPQCSSTCSGVSGSVCFCQPLKIGRLPGFLQSSPRCLWRWAHREAP